MAAAQFLIGDAMPSRDANGRALPALLRFYMPGAPGLLKPVYSDNTLATPLAQPIESDMDGVFPQIWADDAQLFDVAWYDQVFGKQLGAWQNVTTAVGVALLADITDAVDASAASAADAAASESAASASAANAASSAVNAATSETNAETAEAAAIAAASKVQLVPIEGRWKFPFTDGGGYVAGGWRPDGTFEPVRLRAPAGSITYSNLAASVTGRLLPDGADVFFRVMSKESGYRWAFTDNGGYIALGLRTKGWPLDATVDRAIEANHALTADSLAARAAITCWGDSLTDGAGSSGTGAGQGSYPKQLADITGRTVKEEGIGGQGSPAIAARQGGAPALLTVTSNQIPTSGAVAVTAITNSPFNNQGAQTQLGTLCGVPGTLARSGYLYPTSSGAETFAFTRTTTGVAIDCPAGSAFVPSLAEADQADVQVLWVGRNDARASLSTTTKANVAAMVTFLRHDRFIVIGVTTRNDVAAEQKGGTDYNYIVAYNNDLRALYGSRFFDVRRYLIDHGLADAGITPTSDDTAAIALDLIPPSLMYSDGLHLINITYGLIAAQVKATTTAKGW